MTNLPLFQVDVFTKECFKGNACAVVLDADQLSGERMQLIAGELNKSETAFVFQSDSAHLAARFFNPSQEIPLGVDATIAAVFTLVESGRITGTSKPTTVTLNLRDDPITVEFRTGKGQQAIVTVCLRKPEFKQIYEPSSVVKIFGLSTDDLLPEYPIQTVSTGTPHLIVPVRDLTGLKKANFNVDAYREFHRTADFFSPHLFCLKDATEGGHTLSRGFGTPPDLHERAFDGSATGGMAAYIWHYKLIDQPKFVAEQGNWMKRPCTASVEIVGPPNDISLVKVGGYAVTAFRGQLL